MLLVELDNIAYPDCLELQRSLARRRIAGRGPDVAGRRVLVEDPRETARRLEKISEVVARLHVIGLQLDDPGEIRDSPVIITLLQVIVTAIVVGKARPVVQPYRVGP